MPCDVVAVQRHIERATRAVLQYDGDVRLRAHTALRTDFRAEALDGLAIPAEGLTDNLDASADHRAHLVGVMARRAVAAAATRG